MDCGDEVAAWFSTFLNTSGLRLLYCAAGLPTRDMTQVVHKPWGNPSLAGDTVSVCS